MLVPASPLISFRRSPASAGRRWETRFPPHAWVFASGTIALCEGLRLVARAHSLRRVWLPACLCAPVVAAVRGAGLEPKFYDLNDRLEPRFRTLAATDGDALLIVHYLGIAQPMDAVMAVCRERNLVLVEDAAHSLPDRASPVRVGSYGSVAVFSFRKQTPVPDGGLLVVNDPRVETDRLSAPPTAKPTKSTLQKLALMVAERIAFTSGWNLLPIKDRLRAATETTTNGHGAGGTPFEALGPSRWSRLLLQRLDWDELIRRKKTHYGRLSEMLCGMRGVEMIAPSLPPGSVPRALPIRVRDQRKVFHALRRVGIEAVSWPGTAQCDDVDVDSFPGTAHWRERGICLPLNAPLTDRHLEQMARAVACAAC